MDKGNHNQLQIIRNCFDQYGIDYPALTDDEFADWLEKNDFYPRMLDYLSPGVFTPKALREAKRKEHGVDEGILHTKFQVKHLFVIDRIDLEFRKYIISWITCLENAYKTYFCRIQISGDGENVGEKIVPEDALSWHDFLEQLDLSELTELVSAFYDAYKEKGNVPDILQKMKNGVNFISDFGVLRYAAAHGRPILPAFMDPNYHANRDGKFDHAGKRGKAEDWLLCDLLKQRWLKMNVSAEDAAQIVNAIYENPLRRAWVELNYIYYDIVRYVEPFSFKLFQVETERFLDEGGNGEYNYYAMLFGSLRLSDMGNTTLGASPTPYNEIAQEAHAVWEMM
jgi:hypothetical protein